MKKICMALLFAFSILVFAAPSVADSDSSECIKLWVKAKWGKEIVTGVVHTTSIADDRFGNRRTNMWVLLDKPTEKKGFSTVTVVADNISEWKWISCDDVISKHGEAAAADD